MVRPHCGNRRLAVLVIAFGTSIAVLSCASPREGAQNRSSSSSAAATSGESDGGYDISRIAEVEDDFPPGFPPRWFPLHVLNEEQATSVGEVVYGEPSTVDPPLCASVLKPVHATAGTESVGFRADGPQGQMSVPIGFLFRFESTFPPSAVIGRRTRWKSSARVAQSSGSVPRTSTVLPPQRSRSRLTVQTKSTTTTSRFSAIVSQSISEREWTRISKRSHSSRTCSAKPSLPYGVANLASVTRRGDSSGREEPTLLIRVPVPCSHRDRADPDSVTRCH